MAAVLAAMLLGACGGSDTKTLSEDAYVKWFDASLMRVFDVHREWLILRNEAREEPIFIGSEEWNVNITSIQDGFTDLFEDADTTSPPDEYSEGHAAWTAGLECLRDVAQSLDTIAADPDTFIDQLFDGLTIGDTPSKDLAACREKTDAASDQVAAQRFYGDVETDDEYMAARADIMADSTEDWDTLIRLASEDVPGPLEKLDWRSEISSATLSQDSRLAYYDVIGLREGYSALAVAEKRLLQCRIDVSNVVRDALDDGYIEAFWALERTSLASACAEEEFMADIELSTVP